MIHCLSAAKLPQSAARPGSIQVVGPGQVVARGLWGVVASPVSRPPFGVLGEMTRDTWTKTGYPRPAPGLVFAAVPAEAFAHLKAD